MASEVPSPNDEEFRAMFEGAWGSDTIPDADYLEHPSISQVFAMAGYLENSLNAKAPVSDKEMIESLAELRDAFLRLNVAGKIYKLTGNVRPVANDDEVDDETKDALRELFPIAGEDMWGEYAECANIPVYVRGFDVEEYETVDNTTGYRLYLMLGLHWYGQEDDDLAWITAYPDDVEIDFDTIITPASLDAQVATLAAEDVTPPTQAPDDEQLDSKKWVSRDVLVKQVHDELENLFEQTKQWTDRVYETEEEASESGELIANIVREMNNRSADWGDVEFEISGPGVMYLSPQLSTEATNLDLETGRLTVVYDNTTLISNDPLAVRRGFYTRNFATAITKEDDAYHLSLKLTFIDLEKKGDYTIGFDSTNLPLVNAGIVTYFFADLDRKMIDLSVVEYRRANEIEKSLKRIGERFPEYEYLPWQLQELKQILKFADPNAFTPLEDVSLLVDIGSTVGGDEQVVALVVDVLGDILTDHEISVTGPMLDQDGEALIETSVNGLVEQVVSTFPKSKLEEPLLMVRNRFDDAVCYVPLSTIKAFSF